MLEQCLNINNEKIADVSSLRESTNVIEKACINISK
jgi:hypothetical protein